MLQGNKFAVRVTMAISNYRKMPTATTVPLCPLRHKCSFCKLLVAQFMLPDVMLCFSHVIFDALKALLPLDNIHIIYLIIYFLPKQFQQRHGTVAELLLATKMTWVRLFTLLPKTIIYFICVFLHFPHTSNALFFFALTQRCQHQNVCETSSSTLSC